MEQSPSKYDLALLEQSDIGVLTQYLDVFADLRLDNTLPGPEDFKSNYQVTFPVNSQE